jgi:hypothetical protein
MSHLKSIAFQSDETHLENLRGMSDEELIKFGKLVRRFECAESLASCLTSGRCS